MPVSPVRRGRLRGLGRLFAALLVSFALALTLAPRASAQPVAIEPAIRVPAKGPSKAQLAQSKITVKVLNTRPGDRGKTLDYRKAKKAAGSHKTIAQDVALGMMFYGGKVTHRTKADNKALRARAAKLRLPRILSAGTPCAGVNRFEQKSYGARMMLDDCRVRKVISGAETVAFVGGLLVTFFPLDKRAKLIMGIALGVVAAGDFFLRLCNSKHKGVKLYNYSGLGLGLAGWCRSQK